MAKVIQIAVIPETKRSLWCLYALDDTGRTWELASGGEWDAVPPPPGCEVPESETQAKPRRRM